MHNPKCHAAHVGQPWMIHIEYLESAVAELKAGLWKQPEEQTIQASGGVVVDPATANDRYPKLFYYLSADGVATLPMFGPMMKVDSKFGGVNTIRSRGAIRHAANNEAVNAIMLQIDSPGGTVAGTQELGNDVAAVNKIKPVYAQIEDLGASAAYWVAAQASKVYSNAMGSIGSIGTVAVITDSSKAAEMEGVKVHVLSTGDYKGAGAPGAPITDKQIEYLQSRVNDMNEHFLEAVKKGRGMPIAAVREIADGRVHLADKALALGLIDGVQSFDTTMYQITRESKALARQQGANRRARAQLAIEDAE